MTNGDERILNPQSGEDDQQVEKSLRPKRLAELSARRRSSIS